MNIRRLLLRWVLLPVGTLFMAEQILHAYVDHLVLWQYDTFKEYLANPGPWQDSWVIYKCQDRLIAWIYRYQICIIDFAPSRDTVKPIYYLVVVYPASYFLSYLGEGDDRVVTGRRIVWELDDKFNVLADLRMGWQVLRCDPISSMAQLVISNCGIRRVAKTEYVQPLLQSKNAGMTTT